jgi:hypothetical protein
MKPSLAPLKIMTPSVFVYSTLLGQVVAALIMYPEKVPRSEEVGLLFKYAVGLAALVWVPVLFFKFLEKLRKAKPGYVPIELRPHHRPSRIIMVIIFFVCACYFCYFDPQLAKEQFWPGDITMMTLFWSIMISFPVVVGVMLYYKAKDKTAEKNSGA